MDFIDVAVTRFGITPRPNATNAYFVLVQLPELAVIAFLPQFAVALSGGLVALFVAWLTQLFRRCPAPNPEAV